MKRKLKFGNRAPRQNNLPKIVIMTMEHLDKLPVDEVRNSTQLAAEMNVGIGQFRSSMIQIDPAYRALIESKHQWSYANPKTIALWKKGAYNA